MDETRRLKRLVDWATSIGGGLLLPVDIEDHLFVARQRVLLPPSIRTVPMMDACVLETATDKLRFAREASALGLPVPETHCLAEFLAEPVRQRGLRLPWVVKRARGMAGSGSYMARSVEELRLRAPKDYSPGDWVVQEWVPGVDVALTLLADRGEVFAVVMRRRWFTSRQHTVFSPIQNVEFFQEEWLEHLGRRWVEGLHFSGIADFDLRVDFTTRKAWFLECDPRLMAGMLSCELFGVNVPGLLLDRAQSSDASSDCHRTESGCYLSTEAVPEWLLTGAWRNARARPLRTALTTVASDSVANLVRMRDVLMRRRSMGRTAGKGIQ